MEEFNNINRIFDTSQNGEKREVNVIVLIMMIFQFAATAKRSVNTLHIQGESTR